MRAKLTKLSILDGKTSGIGAGRFENGIIFIGRDDGMLKDLGPGDIKVDDMVMVAMSVFYFLKTSQVTKILEQSENCIKFETETSIYELKGE